ncbi:MAG TPA: succinate dehydrogenase flavoprotein subunit [Candidatus Dormibacteraeota bacterium]|nr:succinate dehydrogenase flavoprotein subunit [Candidatus Dormibacteraeota bacterium]
MRPARVILIGGGLAGLMATIRVAELGHAVDLFSVVPVRRSHSVCAQGGINAAKDLKGEGDSTWQHFDDTVYGGDFLQNQPLVKGMCDAAPGIIDLLDRMGVTFNRTAEGLLDFRRFGGTLFNRTAFAGATTGQQLLYALDEQVRLFEAQGRVRKFEGWMFVSAVLDEAGVCRGVCAANLRTAEVRTFPADAVIVATGGLGAVFRHSTNSMACTGSAQSALFQQGAYYANPEMIQVHPTAIPGEDKCRLISESVRGEGGRVWVPKTPGDTRDPRSIPENERYYFLEEWYPKYGNLVPRDVATRAIHKVVYEEGLGIDGKPTVYLDVTHLPREMLTRKLGGVLEIYEKFVGLDPRDHPMKVFPAQHYTMGGLWIDNEKQATNIPGLFAAGECEYQYHGANRLGANSLLSCIYGGMVVGKSSTQYTQGLSADSESTSSGVFESEKKRQEEIYARLRSQEGDQNPITIWKEMGELMTQYVTVTRKNKDLEAADGKLADLQERYKRINLADTERWGNQSLHFTRELSNMLVLARLITQGALLRDESRGAHYKPEFPERDDENWLRTTRAKYENGNFKFQLDPVDTSLITPRKRSYKS